MTSADVEPVLSQTFEPVVSVILINRLLKKRLTGGCVPEPFLVAKMSLLLERRHLVGFRRELRQQFVAPRERWRRRRNRLSVFLLSGRGLIGPCPRVSSVEAL